MGKLDKSPLSRGILTTLPVRSKVPSELVESAQLIIDVNVFDAQNRTTILQMGLSGGVVASSPGINSPTINVATFSPWVTWFQDTMSIGQLEITMPDEVTVRFTLDVNAAHVPATYDSAHVLISSFGYENVAFEPLVVNSSYETAGENLYFVKSKDPFVIISFYDKDSQGSVHIGNVVYTDDAKHDAVSQTLFRELSYTDVDIDIDCLLRNRVILNSVTTTTLPTLDYAVVRVFPEVAT